LLRRLLQNFDHAVDDIIDCCSYWKLDFLLGILLPIFFGMLAIAQDLVGTVFLSDAQVDALRKSADQLLTPAYFSSIGGSRRVFGSGVGMTMFFLAIESSSVRRTASVLLTGTTATGSISV
jgi:hypothetical protein